MRGGRPGRARQRGQPRPVGHLGPSRLGIGSTAWQPESDRVARWFWASGLSCLGAQDSAQAVVSTGIEELTSAVRLRGGDTRPAEMLGWLNQRLAWIAAREGRGDDARTHVDEAGMIAARIGECNSFRRHFGPTNVRLNRLGIGVELGEGGRAYAEITQTPLNVEALGSPTSSSEMHLDLARALAQDGPDRDADAIRHLDTADRFSPQRIRMDPIARDLVIDLNGRARRRVWELDSLCNRFGLSGYVHNR